MLSDREFVCVGSSGIVLGIGLDRKKPFNQKKNQHLLSLTYSLSHINNYKIKQYLKGVSEQRTNYRLSSLYFYSQLSSLCTVSLYGKTIRKREGVKPTEMVLVSCEHYEST